jgi:hypothetical protein
LFSTDDLLTHLFCYQDLLSKVRAMLKASREAVLKEDQMEASLPEAPLPVVAKPTNDSDSDSS